MIITAVYCIHKSYKFHTSTDRHAENTQSSSYLIWGCIPISRTCLYCGQHGNETIVVGINNDVEGGGLVLGLRFGVLLISLQYDNVALDDDDDDDGDDDGLELVYNERILLTVDSSINLACEWTHNHIKWW